MEHLEALAVGREHAEAQNEWHDHWLELTARIGQTKTHLDGEVIRAMAFIEAKKSPLYARAKKAESDFAALRSGADHAICQTEKRWAESFAFKAAEKKPELPKGKTE